MSLRWGVVLAVAVALVVTPSALHARPAEESALAAPELAERVQASGPVAWSGLVETSGALQIPDSDSFATLAQLLGEDNELRVWWRSAEDWRVDRLRSTGETDLLRLRGYQVRYVFESDTATISPVAEVRLPEASDLLPATLGRALLQGARPPELARLPAERVAGVDAAGLRLTPDGTATSVDHVDLWADPGTGLPLRVDLYGRGDRRPVLSTRVADLQLSSPDAARTVFRPAAGTTVDYEESADVAAAANALTEVDLPRTLAGLGTRDGGDPGAVGRYGRGPTTVLVLPLRGQVARPLRDQLHDSAGARQSDLGVVAPVGPLSVLVTPSRPGRGSFLLAGTVTPETLQQAASELSARG